MKPASSSPDNSAPSPLGCRILWTVDGWTTHYGQITAVHDGFYQVRICSGMSLAIQPAEVVHIYPEHFLSTRVH